MVGQRKEQLLRMRGVCGDVTSSGDSDKLYWKLSDTGVFTVRSWDLFITLYRIMGWCRTGLCGRLRFLCESKHFFGWCSKVASWRGMFSCKRWVMFEELLILWKQWIDWPSFLFLPFSQICVECVSIAFSFKLPFTNVQSCVNIWLKGLRGLNRKVAAVVIAAVFWGTWETRNLACFQKKWPDEPVAVIQNLLLV